MGVVVSIPPPVLLSGAFILVLGFATGVFSSRDNAKIPVIGAGSGPLAAQIASMRSLASFPAWVAEGYRKHNPGVFKVRNFQAWLNVVSGPVFLNEFRRAPDNVLSFRGGVEDGLQSEYTFGDWRDASGLHVALIKTRLTRSIEHLFPSVIDELNSAFTEELGVKLDDDEWTALTVMDPISRVVCRTSNRIFVGLPLCRNSEYIDLAVGYAMDVVTSATIISRFPPFLKPIAGRLLTPIPQTYARAQRIMTSLLDERRRQTEENGKDGEEKPDDFLQWILDTGEPRDRESYPLMMRMLRLNFAAISTTTSNFVFALYRLAAEPEKYQEPIRQEVHEVLSRFGWTKTAMDKMHKTDSFLRESLRHTGIGAVAMTRKAMEDFKFSNGTQIKKGELVGVAVRPTHFDSANYSDPETFDGFRFYNKSVEVQTGDEVTNRLVSISPEFLAFGIGKHACPGRFWAATEMKAMMAYMVTHYDVKMEQDGVLPKDNWIGSAIMPDKNARVLIRRRGTPIY